MKTKVYIAAPFFNETQLAIVEAIKKVLDEDANIEYFSPKDESMFKQGDDPKYILDLNCKAILNSDVLLAVTNDKDVGTMFECGYAYANLVPILYIWLGRQPGQKFNLMLAASGHVIESLLELIPALRGTVTQYDGLIE